MTTRYWYRDNTGTITEFTSYVHEPLDVTTKAEEGATAGSIVIVDDPTGAFDVNGLRKVYITETADTAQSIYVGYTDSRKVERAYPFNGAARRWTLNLNDLNTVLDRRIMNGADANRPAETDVARVTWLMSTNEAALVEDSIYISAAKPVNMDKSDYRGQGFKGVLDDCASQSGKNYYVTNIDAGNPNGADTNDFTLWYGHDDLAVYSSTVKLSNVSADVNDTTVLAVGDNPTLERRPDRVASGVYGNYKKGHIYRERLATATDYARKDVSASWPNVKTAGRAEHRALRYLQSLSTEEDTIEVTVKVDAARVNIIREGQRIEAKFSHLPGYESAYTWMRVMQRTVRQLGPWDYELGLTLSGPSPTQEAEALGCADRTPSGFYPAMGSFTSDATGNILYLRPGIAGAIVPTPGFVGSGHFPGFGPGVYYLGDCTESSVRCVVVGDGQMVIRTVTGPAGAAGRTISATLRHDDGGGFTDEAQSGILQGSTITFDISTHGGAQCTHWVDITDDGGPCGGTGWGFAGFTWAAT